MRHRRAIIIFALLALTALGGCASRGTPGTSATEARERPPAAPTATTMQHSTVKVSDPQHQWSFEGVARQVTQTGTAGPYDMVDVRGTYKKAGDPPVHMWAQRIRLDKQRNTMVLQGKVKVVGGAVTVEGDRIEYNLKTGEVVASSQTKWTFAPGEGKPEQMAAGKEGKP